MKALKTAIAAIVAAILVSLLIYAVPFWTAVSGVGVLGILAAAIYFFPKMKKKNSASSSSSTSSTSTPQDVSTNGKLFWIILLIVGIVLSYLYSVWLGLTLTGIGCGFSILEIAMSFKEVKTGYKGIYFVAGEPRKIKGPGWRMAWWPFCKIQEVEVQKESVNIDSMKMETTLNPFDPNSGPLDVNKHSTVPVGTGEMSLTFQPALEGTEKDLEKAEGNPRKAQTFALLRYFEYVQEKGKETIKENLRDFVQASLRDELRFFGLLQARLAGSDFVKKIRDSVEAKLMADQVPVKLISLVMNTTIRSTNEKIESEIQRKAEMVLQQEADLAEADKEIQVAEKKKEVEKINAQAKAISLTELLRAYKLPGMKDDDFNAVIQFHLQKEAIEAYKKMAESPNKTFVISPDILGQITTMLGAFGKSQNP